MKKRILTIMLASVLAIATLAGCGKTEPEDATNEAVTEAVDSVEDVVEEAEAPHEHTYTEEVTKEATCLEDGEKTLTCECGETTVEEIPATGHDFSNYVSNEDATYEADGTETATCACGETDTRTAEGSMLTYTFEDMDATKYAKSTVNVRSLPNTDGEKLGGLNLNDEVKVTGKCAETGWYRIEYADGIAYVSDDYLVDDKVEEKPATSTAASTSAFPYEMYKVYDNGSIAWIYMTHNHGYSDIYWNAYNPCKDLNRAYFPWSEATRYGDPAKDAAEAAACESLGIKYNIGNDATPWTTPEGERIWIYFAY